MELFSGSVGFGTLALLFLCLGIALAFEFVNGFHDTANAVATVIYTKSLPPKAAVLWSGFMNFLGVLFGGTAVAFSIVYLLPVDLLINIGKSAGLLMVLSLLLSAILWNVGTWYFGLPSSSSHALIGSIIGVGLASSLFTGNGFGSGVNWGKALDVGKSLFLSPLAGFCFAALLLLVMKKFIKSRKLYEEPDPDNPPPFWIRAVLFLTCTGVSYAHGSNDGQKGIGLIMLILIGVLPAQYALNNSLDGTQIGETVAVVRQLEGLVAQNGNAAELGGVSAELAEVRTTLEGRTTLRDLPEATRTAIRADILDIDSALSKFEKAQGDAMSAAAREELSKARKKLKKMTDFVVSWVVVAVALALGIGTTIGYKRIVVTIGEKIGKSHLTYAQGAAAETVAMSLIYIADAKGLPVSTTHVLSSGIAGTMAANRFGLQPKTVRNIALAWVLTLPVTMLLSGLLFVATASGAMKDVGTRARIQPRQEKVLKKLE